MDIISAQEFNHQSHNHNSSFEKVYDSRVLTSGVIFSKKQKEAAMNYCLTWINNNQSCLCLLVEDTNQLQVWYEIPNRQTKKESESSFSTKNSSSLKTNPDLSNKNKSQSLLASRHLQIDREFVAECQKIVTNSIGPIAKIIVKKVLNQDTQANREQFVNNLIQHLQQNQQLPNIQIRRQLKALLNR